MTTTWCNEIGQRVAALDKVLGAFTIVKRRRHGALDLVQWPPDVGAVAIQHVELPADRGATVGHVE